MANPIALPGTVVPSGAEVSPGGAQGVQGIQGPTSVSADAGNIATLGSDNLILVPQQTLWYQRLRSFNAAGNPNFEVTQRNCGGTVTNPTSSTFIEDRWMRGAGTGTFTTTCFCQASGSTLVVPGTNYRISGRTFTVQLTGQQTSLAAGDALIFVQNVEGPMLRELIGDVTSLTLLVQCTAPLKFAVTLRTAASPYYSLTKLCTIPAANTWTLLTLPNLPVWSPSGTWPIQAGSAGYTLLICLATGSTLVTPANDTWQSGNFAGAIGMDNFCALPVNSIFYCGFLQHEPGSVCTTLMDKPFSQNYDECLRYFCKSYPYGTSVGGANSSSYSLFNSVIAVSGACNFQGGVKFPRQMAKTPTCTVYAQNNGNINNAYVFYATSGTVPNTSGNNAISSVTASASGIANLVGNMTSTSPVTAYAEWTADTSW